MKSKFRQIVEALPPFRRRHARIRTMIADRVNALLRNAQMKQVDLAKAVGVGEPRISRILRGTEGLTTETIAKLEVALGRDIVRVLLPNEDERPISIGAGQLQLRIELIEPSRASAADGARFSTTSDAVSGYMELATHE